MSGDENRVIHEKPGHLIRRLQQIAVALFVSETNGFEITPVQYAALLAVSLHPSIDQTALVNIIAYDRSTIGEVIARLVTKKLVRRTKGESDGRTKVLHVTAAGKHLLHDIQPFVLAAQRQILAPLSPEERTLFMKMLARLVDLNNERSRAPQRSKHVRGRHPARAGAI
jgi:DNA-binding MarR family transcriptional regulator